MKEKKLSKKTIEKVNELMRFMSHLPQVTQESFNKLCEEKEIRL